MFEGRDKKRNKKWRSKEIDDKSKDDDKDREVKIMDVKEKKISTEMYFEYLLDKIN